MGIVHMPFIYFFTVLSIFDTMPVSINEDVSNPHLLTFGNSGNYDLLDH